MQNRESAKKAAASAAANNAVSPVGRRSMVEGAPLLDYAGAHGDGSPQEPQNALTQTASWLDRANAILRGTEPGRFNAGTATSTLSLADELGSMPSSDIEDQMREVQRLIYEGPLIQQTTAGLPHLLDRSRDVPPMMHASGSEDSVPVQTLTYKKELAPNSAEPADKRMRTGHGDGAEDAEALVGFLRSVRASAASGQDA
jgi:hypothetical protein